MGDSVHELVAMSQLDMSQFKERVGTGSDLEFLHELGCALDCPEHEHEGYLSPAANLVADRSAELLMIEIQAAVKKGDFDLELLRRIALFFNQRTAVILLQKMASLKIHNCVERFCKQMLESIQSVGSERAYAMISDALAT